MSIKLDDYDIFFARLDTDVRWIEGRMTRPPDSQTRKNIEKMISESQGVNLRPETKALRDMWVAILEMWS